MAVVKLKVSKRVPKIRTLADNTTTVEEAIESKWVPLYVNNIKGRLRKDKNLEDIPDKAAARKALELDGFVDTHEHLEYKKGISDLWDAIDKKYTELHDFAAGIREAGKSDQKQKEYDMKIMQDTLNTLVDAKFRLLQETMDDEIGIRGRQDNYLQGALDLEQGERDQADKAEAAVRKETDDELKHTLSDHIEESETKLQNLTDKIKDQYQSIQADMTNYKNKLMAEMKKEAATASIPVGCVVAWPSAKAIPSDFLECNGQPVNSISYPALAAIMGNTPDMRDVFLQGSTNPGNTVAAGLPNISGWFDTYKGNEKQWVDGTLFQGTTTTPSSDTSTGAGDTRMDKVEFDASKVNPIYGSSNTVQPPAYTVKWIIKAK